MLKFASNFTTLERFRQRLKFYLVGLTIGLLLVFMIFGNRGCSWLPGNRVKNMIAEKELFTGDSLWDVMKCSGLSASDIYSLLNEAGDVNFSKSETQSEPKKYLLEGEKDNKVMNVTYALYDSTAEVIDFYIEGAPACTSLLSNKNKRIIPLPDEDVRAIISQHELRILNTAQCQMECLGITEEELLHFHESAEFSVEGSRPRLYPNPEYRMKGIIKGTEYAVLYIISENRSRIAEITPNQCGCE